MSKKEKKAIYKGYCIFRNENTEEEIPAFRLNDKRHEFFMSMPAMLKLLAIASKNGSLPKIPDKWCIDVRKRYLSFDQDRQDDDIT